MARKEAGSRVKFRVTIPTNMGDKFPDCTEDISSWASNFGHYHCLSAGSHFENTSQKGRFGRSQRRSVLKVAGCLHLWCSYFMREYQGQAFADASDLPRTQCSMCARVNHRT